MMTSPDPPFCLGSLLQLRDDASGEVIKTAIVLLWWEHNNGGWYGQFLGRNGSWTEYVPDSDAQRIRVGFSKWCKAV